MSLISRARRVCRRGCRRYCGYPGAFLAQFLLRQETPLSRYHEQDLGINAPTLGRSLHGQTSLFKHLVADFFGLWGKDEGIGYKLAYQPVWMRSIRPADPVGFS